MSLVLKLLRGGKALANKLAASPRATPASKEPLEPRSVEPVSSRAKPVHEADCPVCSEDGPSIMCAKVCGRAYHPDCLPELRGRMKKGLPIWPDWVCPPCRGAHRLGPVVVAEGGDPSSTTLERVANGGVLGALLEQLNVAASLRPVSLMHDEACRSCGGPSSDVDPLVLCDGVGCSSAWHIACAPTLAALGAVPDGEWLCAACANMTTPTTAEPDTRSGTVVTEGDSNERGASTASVTPTVTREPSAPVHASESVCEPAAPAVAGKKAARRNARKRLPCVSSNEPGNAAIVETESPAPAALTVDAATDVSPGDSADTVAPFDDAIEGWAGGTAKWTALVAKARDARVKDELRHPPKYSYLSRCRWRVPRPKSSRRGSDEGVCQCEAADSACDDSCLNRGLNIECTAATCSWGADDGPERHCLNRDLQRRNNSRIVARPTPGKGWGLFAESDIPAGAFVVEYTGEILDDALCEQRLLEYKAAGQAHYHIMEISRDLVIDA